MVAGPKGPAYNPVRIIKIRRITVGGFFRARHQIVQERQSKPVKLSEAIGMSAVMKLHSKSIRIRHQDWSIEHSEFVPVPLAHVVGGAVGILCSLARRLSY